MIIHHPVKFGWNKRCGTLLGLNFAESLSREI